MNYRITGTGSCTPDITKKTSDFLQNKFLDRDGSDIQSSNPEIIEKFKSITGITERRYASDKINCSDLAADGVMVLFVKVRLLFCITIASVISLSLT